MSDKSYEATIRLGISTITDDAEGEVLAAAGAAGLGEAEIKAAMAKLRGDILQVPAAVSAIKIDGVRSYRRVRAGQSVELSERPVTIRRFDLLGSRELEVDGVGCVDLKRGRRVLIRHVRSRAGSGSRGRSRGRRSLDSTA